MGIAMYYRGFSCLLAAGFALAAAQAATDTSWSGGTGGTMSSPKELYNKGNWKSGKVPSTSYNLVFGVNSLVATNNHTSANIANDIKVNGGDYTFLGSLEFETLWTVDSASKNTIVKKGDWKLTYGYRQAIAENSYSAITNASGNMKITGEHYIRAGEGKNSTAIIENQAGNWTLAHHFKVANGEGSKGEIYWRKGNLSFSKDYVLYIGNGKNSTGKVEIYGGTWTPTNNMHVASGVGAAATLLLKGGTINAKGNFYIGNNTGANGAVAVDSGRLNVASGKTMYIGRGGGTGSLTVNGGTLSLGGDCVFGNGDSGSEGTLTINGGTVTVASGKWTKSGGGTGTINLNGGTLETRHIRDDSGSIAVNFNGGTLKANEVASNGLLCHGAGSGIAVTVGEKGGTIDTGDFDISIPVAISGAGGMTFKGGGVVTLASGNTYTGATTVEVGTTVHVPAPGEIVGGLAVTLPETPPADGVYTLLVCDGEGAFADSVLKVVAAPDNSRVLVTTGGKSVVCVYGDDPGPLWVGGTSGSLGEAANWANNAVPGAGVNCVIGSVAAASLTNPSGSAFAPASITFPADSAAVAISGENPITGIAAITNLSPTVSHTINVPVCFAGDIQVRQNADYYEHMAEPHIVFAGGAHAGEGCSIETGSTVKWSRCMFGEYSIDSAADARWTATQYSNCRPAVTDNSSLYVPYAGNLTELYVGANAKVFVGDVALEGRFMYRMDAGAEMVVTNLTVTGSDNRYVSYDQGTSVPGTFKFKSVINSLTGDDKRFYLADGHIASRHVFFIGEGGLNFLNAGATSYYNLGRGDGGNAETIRPWYSDFTIAGSDGRSASGWDVILHGAIDFCTDDENGTGRTITIGAVTRATAETAITVSGKGTLRVDKAAINYGQPAVTVSDTATLAYARGASLGTGPLALGAGTMLAVSSADLPLNVEALALPDSGTATIRIAGDAAIPDGEYTLFSTTTPLPSGFDTKINLVLPDGSSATRRLYTTDSCKLILMLGEGSLPSVWTGAANDGKMNTPGNWLNGTVPYAGAAVFIPATAGTLYNDIEEFAPASVTFGYGNGVVTIEGNAISGVAAITNLSSASHTINAPVAFADKILVVQGAMSWEQKSGTSVRFAGGVTGTTFADGTARYLDGAFSLSTGAGWVANTQGSNNRWGLPTGSWLTLPEATDTCELTLGDSSTAGGAFTTGVLRTSARLLCWNYGEYVVTNEFEAVFPEEAFLYCGHNDISNGKFKFEKITLSGGTGSNPILKFGNAYSSTADTGTQQFYIGRGGLCFAEEACNTLRYEAGGAKNNATVRIDPWHGDYTIHTKSASDPTDFTVSTKTYFGTTDESGKACTVTDEGVIASYDVGEIHIDGKGTFVVNAVGKATCPATVHGGSGTTLAIKAGKKLTTGLITVNSGATLQVSKSGTVSLGGLMLKSGATLGFTFTKQDAAPILKLSGALGEFTVPLKVCSFNIRCISSSDTGDKAWDNRKAALVKLVKNIDPDIIGFQEVKDDQFTYLKQQLPDYDFLSKNRGGSSGGNEAVSIAWRKARFSKTAGGTFWLSGTPSKESKFEESDLNRICTWALFNDSCTGRQFCFANTHLDLQGAARPKQMQVIMDQLSKYFDNGVPFALTGDMNCDERASPIKDVAYAHLSDACLVSRTSPTGPWRTYNAWNYKDASAESPCASVMEEPVSERNIGGRVRIDFMLTSQNVGVASFAIRNDPQSGKKQYPSDHFPIVGELLPATGGGKYKVKVDRSCPHVSAGRHVLTQGAKLANADNIDFDLPKWVERAAVEDGEIVLYAKPPPFKVILR